MLPTRSRPPIRRSAVNDPITAPADTRAPTSASATHLGSLRRRLAVGALAIALLVGAGALGFGMVGVLLLSPTPGAFGAPRFVDQARAAGVEHRYDGAFEYIVGGGVAAFDCDDDRLPDLYLAGGEGPAALFRNETAPDGTLRFARAPAATTDLEAVTGAYPLDIDGDRHTDLVVLRHGPDAVLRGLGDCRFEDAGASLGLTGGPGWTVGFSATWEGPAATLPTLAFGDYVGVDAEGQATYDCPDNVLVRPASDAGHAPYGTPTALSPGWCPLSMLFSDWDRSGRQDLRISNDRHYHRDGEEQLWRIAPDEPPRSYGRDDGWAPLRIWGMGIASRDLTGDGYPEVYLTSQADNKLQTLADGPDQPAYEDIALRLGVTAHRPYGGDVGLPSTGWHAAFEDLNDDGFTDLYVSKGNVAAQEDYAKRDPSNLLLGQADGTFQEAGEAAGLMDFGTARGAALVDLDLDGRLDLVQVLRHDNVRVWRNMGVPDGGSGAAGLGHWLGIALDQDSPNHDAVGAWVTVRVGDRIVTEREVTVGGGHASGTLGPIHVGLGSATAAEVRVTWPDGEVGPWQPVDADRYVTIRRGAPAVEPWS